MLQFYPVVTQVLADATRAAADGTTKGLFDRPWTLVMVLLVLLVGLGLVVARRFVLRGLAFAVTRRPWFMLIIGAVVTVGALTTVPFLKVSTSRTNLLDKDNPYQRQLVAFLNEFGSQNHLIAVVEGGTSDRRHAAADELAKRLMAAPNLARSVYYKIDLNRFKREGLLYLPLAQLKRLRSFLANPNDPQSKEHIRGFLGVRSLKDMLIAINKTFSDAMAHPDAAMKEKGSLQAGLKIVQALLDEMVRWVQDPKRTKIQVFESMYFKKFDLSKSNLDKAGYLADRKHKRVFLFIRPESDSDETSALTPMVHDARRIAAKVARKYKGVTIGFTGYPALQVDEMDTLKKDMFFTTILALIGTLLLFALVFRSARQTALAVAALLTGILWSLGACVLIYGHLNLITSLFFAILIGLGIDFSIHILSRFNEERAKEGTRKDAVRRTLMGVGPGLLTGAMTTAAAFYATAISKFTAFSELGVIAGTGLMLVMLASVTILPALLVVTRPPKHRKKDAKGARKAVNDKAEMSAAVAARLVTRWPLAVIVAAALVTLPTILRPAHIPFDYNLTTMLPAGTQSRQYYMEMVSESNFSAEFINLIADSLSDARELTKRLKGLGTVKRVESIATVVPPKQKEKLAILQTMRPIFQGIDTRYRQEGPVDVTAVQQQLEALYDNLDDALEQAQRVKRPEVPYLKKLIASVQRVKKALKKADPPLAQQRLTALQSAAFTRLSDGLRQLKTMLAAHEVTADSLPEGVKNQFVGKDKKRRRYALYVYPKKSIWNRAFLGEFVKETRSVDPHATGFPVNYYEHVRMIKSGFVQAAFLAGLAIVVMLLLDFSRERYVIFGIVPMAILAVWSYSMTGWIGGLFFLLGGAIGMALFDWKAVMYTALAIIPLAMGAAWMVAMMGVLKIPYNLANIVALPLIIGIGVVYGIHIIHRFREEHGGNVYNVVRHTGGAVTLAALTTMVGFGSLITASHQAAKIMGETMVIGVTTCLITSVIVLPALLRYVPWVGKAEVEDAEEDALEEAEERGELDPDHPGRDDGRNDDDRVEAAEDDGRNDDDAPDADERSDAHGHEDAESEQGSSERNGSKEK